MSTIVVDQKCPSCMGTGQPGGIKGGPEHGLCGTCRGSGRVGIYPHPIYRSPAPKRNEPMIRHPSDHVTDRSLLSGRVKRYACWPTIREQTTGDHTWRVYHVYWRIFGVPEAEVALYIHLHDAEEIVVGDNPFPMKMRYPRVKEALKEPESDARILLDLPEQSSDVDDRERAKVKICDLIEMYVFGQEEREMGNLLATPIIERTRDAAVLMARNKLSIEDHGRVVDFLAREDARHHTVLIKQGSTL